MFDSTPIPSDRNSSDLSLNQLRDGLASLNHRVGEIESLFSKKIDRSECLSILQKKASHGQLKRSLDDLENRLREERHQQIERNTKMQDIAIGKINQLGNKLKSKHSKGESKVNGKDIFKRIIQPQQLYIQSNETMFSLLIEEVAKLQANDDDFQKQLELRNKKNISLNNQVCNKLERIQAEIEEKMKYNSTINESKVGNTWSHLDKTNNKQTVHQCNNNENNQFESFRFDMLTKNIETLQKELLNKMNIRDVLPLIRQNCQPLSESLDEVREYVEQSMESTKRILSSQTEINKEISLGVKLAWWHSFEQEHQFAIINKEIINLVPELIEIGQGHRPNFVTVHQPGLYLVKIYPIQTGEESFIENQEREEVDDQIEVMIDTELHILGHENVIRLEKNSQLRVILRVGREIAICLQKL